ncbi:MAG: GatB/YqeY domain-containing protein [Nitrospinae bacterium]|nr:GatB/YqeY domain-containing protein [Nitrospinota bacterium]
MSIKEKLTEDMKTAMKAKDSARLSTIRMLNSVLKNREIDQRRELSDEEVVAAISTAVKQRRDSIEQFKAGGRQDLVEKEEAEVAILMAYLPQQLTEDEIRDIVKAAIAETSATSGKDMGKVMKVIMPKTKGKADGGLVNKVVKELLGA